MCRSRSIVALFVLLVGHHLCSSAPVAAVDYLTEIKPLLAEKCYSCHGALEQESDLRLETRNLMVRGGDSGAVIVPGDAQASLLLERVMASADERMPPADQGAAMTPDQISLIRQWIQQGAPAPDEATPVAPSQHWAFQPIVRPAISLEAKSLHPIDALLQAKQRELHLQPVAVADRSIRIRRLYLDLIGLPPTLSQMQDDRPWREIVDELLANPQHGERWGRHWMDIWRYCDWYGLNAQLRFSQKHLWHWRDWIVESLNQDKGYDRMILEMLAGDELEPDNPKVVAATGYLARNYYLFNRTTWLDSTIEHTGKAFLGLTLNCAKCHDHKYDPLSQLDYYRMRAIFEPHQVRLDPVPGVTNFEQDGLPRVFDDHVEIQTFLHVRGDPNAPDMDHPIEPGVPEILASFAPPIEPVTLPATAFAPGIRDHVQEDQLREAETAIDRARQSLLNAKEQLSKQTTSLEPTETPDRSTQTSFEFTDDFQRPDPESWTMVGEGWEYREGAVHQSMPTRQPHMLRLNRSLPRDFELLCQYTTTGGTTYKSVTFRFDQSEDGSESNYVYTSAHESGPKVQAAFSRAGKSTYPPEGRRRHAIRVGQTYDLRFAIRGQLVNVWLDGEFMFAYRFPSRREGFLSLSGFDATVAFESITIRTLADDVELKSATNETATTDAPTAVAIAEAKLAAAEADFKSLQATFAADRSRFDAEGASGTAAAPDLADIAAQRQIEAEISAAEVQLLDNASDAKAVEAAKKRIKAAESQLSAAQSDSVHYQSFRGAKKALESPAHKETDYPPTYAPQSTGRRLALAQWIASAENPLTARVAVNHVWMRHFGTPLVESVFDFGLRAKSPLHADVLDWLADEFIASGWSFRHLHRLIVTSQAYQLRSTSLGSDEATAKADPTNQYYWRMNSRRMESQLVRDSLLFLAGRLDLTLGGPSLDPSRPSNRRSLYFQHSRDQQDKFLEMFDDADELQCYRRSESIVPQQALALSNSKLAIEMASHLALRLSRDVHATDRAEFIQAVFEWLLARSATNSEVAQCMAYFDAMSSLAESNQRNASDDDGWELRLRQRFVQALFNHNDFITIR